MAIEAFRIIKFIYIWKLLILKESQYEIFFRRTPLKKLKIEYIIVCVCRVVAVVRWCGWRIGYVSLSYPATSISSLNSAGSRAESSSLWICVPMCWWVLITLILISWVWNTQILGNLWKKQMTKDQICSWACHKKHVDHWASHSNTFFSNS